MVLVDVLVVVVKTAHSCPIILNNSYNGVPPAPGTGMAQSLGLSHSSARSRGHPIVPVVQYDWTTVCCFDSDIPTELHLRVHIATGLVSLLLF